MKGIFRFVKSALPITLLFVVTGLIMVSIPEASWLRFSEVWESAGMFFVTLKACFFLFLIIRWRYCCEKFCAWRGRPEVTEDLIAKWPLIFSVIFVVELVGVWR